MSQEYPLSGWELLDIGNSEAARVAFAETLEDDPKNAKAMTGLGFSFIQLGRLDEAFETLRTALTLEPDNANAHYGAGWILRRQKRKREARFHAQKAVALAPDVAQYHLLAAACARRGDTQTILARLEAANRLDPQMLDSRNRLALVYYRVFAAENQTRLLLAWLAIATTLSYVLSANGWNWWFLVTGVPFLVAGGWNITKGHRRRAVVSLVVLAVWVLLAFVAHWSGLSRGV